MTAAPHMFESLVRIDEKLVRRGILPLTPFWRAEAEKFYSHATARTWVACVGRGGVKSATSVKIAVNEIAFGDFAVPPGERHYWIHVAENKDEATSRRQLACAAFDALGVKYNVVGDAIELGSRRLGFRIVAARIGAVSGWRAFGTTKDELSKWRDDSSGANPAAEIAAWWRALSDTPPSARHVEGSSPIGTTGYFADAVACGSNDRQLVSMAPTWVANPSVTEEQTHDLEPDERIWRREYAAIPQAGALGAFDLDALERAFRTAPPATRAQRIMVIDASSGRKDSWTWARLGYDTTDGASFLSVDSIAAVDGGFWKQTSGEEIVARIATEAKASGISLVVGDQREALMLGSAFQRANLSFRSIPWTNNLKIDAVARVRRWFADGRIVLPDDDVLRRELREFEERITPSGAFTYGARGNGHDDRVALLLTAAMADEQRLIPGSPIAGVHAEFSLKKFLAANPHRHIPRLRPQMLQLRRPSR